MHGNRRSTDRRSLDNRRSVDLSQKQAGAGEAQQGGKGGKGGADDDNSSVASSMNS